MIETVAVALGASVAKAVMKTWLKDHALARDVGLTTVELLEKQFPQYVDRRRAKRQVERIAEAVGARLAPVIEIEFRSLDSGDLQAALDIVGAAIDSTPLSLADMQRIDFEPRRLRSDISLHIDRGQAVTLSEPGREILKLATTHAATLICEFSAVMEGAEAANVIELLRRESDIARKIDQIVASLPPAHGSAKNDGEKFRRNYLEAMRRKTQLIELFGVDSTRSATKYGLEPAYVGLSVENRVNHTARLADDLTPQSSDHGTPITDALSNSTRWILIGEPGFGKTTLLHWLTTNCITGNLPKPLSSWNGLVPFLIVLREYADRPFPQPESFIAGSGTFHEGTMPSGWVQEHLESGQALVLVDGIDEVPADRRPKLLTWFSNLVTTFPKCHFIATSRPTAAGQGWKDLKGFQSTEILPMSPFQTSTFIKRWHQAAFDGEPDPENKCERYQTRLQERLRSSPKLANLATTPLVCAILCALNRDTRGNLPQDRANIYRSALRTLVVSRDFERDIDDPSYSKILEPQRMLLLQNLAYWLVRNNRSEATDAQVARTFEERAKTFPSFEMATDEILRCMIERSGVLRRPAAGSIDFIHRTFLEFLAAQAVVHVGDIGVLLNHAEDDDWTEVIVFAAGEASEQQRNELLAGLLDKKGEAGQPNHRCYLLALACLETSPSVTPELMQRLTVALEAVLPPGNVREARAVAQAGAVAIPLLSSIDKANAIETKAIVRSLTEIGSEQALTALARFSNDKRLTVKRELIRAWDYFDLEDFVDVVLANAKLEQGHLDILSLEKANLLDKFTRLESVHLWLSTDAQLVTRSVNAIHAEVIAYLELSGPLDLDLLARRFPNLSVLYVTGTYSLLNTSSLRTLPLAILSATQLLGLRDLGSMPKSLVQARFSSMPDLTDAGALDGSTTLQDLHLVGTGAAVAPQRLPALHSLSLADSPCVDADEPLGSDRLRKIDVTGTMISNLDNLLGGSESVKLVADRCYELQELTPSTSAACTSISARSNSYLASASLSGATLRYLDCAGSRNLQALRIDDSCINLVGIDISGAESVAISGHLRLPGLKFALLANCAEHTIEKIVDAAPELDLLDLRGTTADFARRMQQTRPGLRVIVVDDSLLSNLGTFRASNSGPALWVESTSSYLIHVNSGANYRSKFKRVIPPAINSIREGETPHAGHFRTEGQGGSPRWHAFAVEL